jgi:hypothetical protein
LVDHLYAGAEYEDEEKNGNIPGIDEGLLEIAGSLRVIGRAQVPEFGLQAAKKIMVDTGKETIENEEGKDDQGIVEEFFIFEQFGYDQVGIEIIEGDQQGVVKDKKSREIPFGKKRKIPGTRIKYKRQHEETGPGCYMDNDLYGNLLQNDIIGE